MPVQLAATPRRRSALVSVRSAGPAKTSQEQSQASLSQIEYFFGCRKPVGHFTRDDVHGEPAPPQVLSKLRKAPRAVQMRVSAFIVANERTYTHMFPISL